MIDHEAIKSYSTWNVVHVNQLAQLFRQQVISTGRITN